MMCSLVISKFPVTVSLLREGVTCMYALFELNVSCMLSIIVLLVVDCSCVKVTLSPLTFNSFCSLPVKVDL